jgi:hypothetical protein
MKSLIKSVLIALMSLVAIFCLLVAYTFYSNVTELKQWQKITATVVSSGIEQEQRAKGTTNCPVVLVRYNFQGKSLTSKLVIENTPCNTSKSSVLSTIKNFTPSMPIEVFVNPTNASQIRSASFSLNMYFYLMIFCAVLMLYGAVVLARSSVSPSIKRDTELA